MRWRNRHREEILVVKPKSIFVAEDWEAIVDAITRARLGQRFESAIVSPIWAGEVAGDNRLVQAIFLVM